MAKISVIVPVYKTKKYLEKCINSLISQTYSDIEIILVDDGSPDDSGAMCDEFALLDSRIQVIHKENGGLTSARLAGFRTAKGEYISFVDSDDYIHPNMMEELFAAAERHNAQLAICGYTSVFPHGQQDILPPWSQDHIDSHELAEAYRLPLVGRILDGKHINIPGFMCIRLFRKDLIQESYFISEREVFTEDDLFNLHYSSSVRKIAVVHKPLYFYVQHPESLSNCYRPNKWDMLQRRYDMCYDWLVENELVDAGKDRLNAAAFSAIFASLDNAIPLGSYKEFHDKTKNIRQSSFYRKSLREITLKNLSAGQKIVCILLRLRCLRGFYFYRKRRLN